MADQTRSGQDESADPGVGLPLPPPPPPTFAEVLLLIERNRMDNMRMLEAIERNTSHLPRATESGQGSGHQQRSGVGEEEEEAPHPDQPTHPGRCGFHLPSCSDENLVSIKT